MSKKTSFKKWEIIYDETISRETYNEYVGMYSNGEDMIFFRVDKDEFCHIFLRLSTLLYGKTSIVYKWTAENDEKFLNFLNDLEQERQFSIANGGDKFEASIRFWYQLPVRWKGKFGDWRGPDFVKAIIRYLKEKKRNGVTFETNTYYENWCDIPYCNRFEYIVDTVSIDQEHPDKICIAVCREDGFLAHDWFDGTEKEDFEYLFHEIYYYINDAEDPEAEEWLEMNGLI